MKALITAGGTSERIDAVRMITNNSTGRLGLEIANAFFAQGADVFYVAGKNAARPSFGQIYDVLGVLDAQRAIEEILTNNKIDAIIHAMAVSDYFIKNPAQGKISSEIDEITITLTKAPKIIANLRKLAPDALIIGFKLLSDVSEDELINVGHSLLKKHSLDYVLANDAKAIDASDHKGFLIDENKNFETFIGKTEIAKGIVNSCLKK